VMSEQKVPRSVEQRIVIKFLVGENVPSAEIHHRIQQQYGEECLLRRHSSPYCCWSLRSAACLHTNQSRSYLNHLVLALVKGRSIRHDMSVPLFRRFQNCSGL